MSKVIKVGENFRIKSDNLCWILESRHEGMDKKTKEPKAVWTTTYHPSFAKIAQRIVENEAKQAETLDELVTLMSQRVSDLEKSIVKVEEQ